MTIFTFFFGTGATKPAPQAVRMRPNPRADFHLREAQRFFQASAYPQALLHCEQALNLDATDPAAFRLRGVIRYELQDTQGATQDLKRSLHLGGTSAGKTRPLPG